jgi:hypothetical protein
MGGHLELLLIIKEKGLLSVLLLLQEDLAIMLTKVIKKISGILDIVINSLTISLFSL